MSIHLFRRVSAAELLLAAIMAAAALYPLSSLAQDAGYHILEKQHLDGDVKWDYLSIDSEHRHLFIAHGDRVDVFDLDKKQVIGNIPAHGVHGVAIAPEFDRGYATNGSNNSVTIFVLSTLQVVGSAATEKKPDGIVYDPATKRVFAVNGGAASVTPIDAATGKPLAAIPLGGSPEFLVSDGKGRLFINLEDKNQVLVIDTHRLTVTHRYDLSARCDEPAGLSIDLAAQRLFVGCHNQKMAVVDANTGKIVDAPTIGRGSDATAFDAAAKLAFSSNGDGTLNVIDASDARHYAVKQTVTTMPRARTMAIDPASHKIYLVAAEAEPIDSAATQAPPRRPQLKAGTFTLITVGQ
ncbi:MAG: YncE family protein [Betaproteobacteria bacterium]|nr:YncE family protein [Betaproteobacteria bacterium]